MRKKTKECGTKCEYNIEGKCNALHDGLVPYCARRNRKKREECR